MPYPDRFYPVVDSVAWVARLTKLGVGTIQLRAKNLDDAAALTMVKEALAELEPRVRDLKLLGSYPKAVL